LEFCFERRDVNKIEFIKRDNLELRSGAKTLLKSLNENEIEIGLITNSPDSSVDLIIRHFELDQHINFYRGVTGLEDLGKEKPDTWHIEIAKSEIDRPPFVYLGDSVEDVKAAENATIDSIKLGGNQDLNELKDRLV
jgi:HAD superfamily hydrolase (TIGR01549 family)